MRLRGDLLRPERRKMFFSWVGEEGNESRNEQKDIDLKTTEEGKKKE